MSGSLAGFPNKIALTRRCPDRCEPPPPCNLNHFIWCVCTFEQAPTTVPRITTSSLPAAVRGVPYSHTLAATNTPTSWAVTGTLPAGLSFNTTTGEISGTPTASGAVTLSFTATNADGTGPARSLRLTVNNPPAFAHPAYRGQLDVHAVAPDAATIAALGTQAVSGGSVMTVVTTAPPPNRHGVCFAYPDTLPLGATLTQTPPGLDVLSGFTVITVAMPDTSPTAAPGATVDYRVYYTTQLAPYSGGQNFTLTLQP